MAAYKGPFEPVNRLPRPLSREAHRELQDYAEGMKDMRASEAAQELIWHPGDAKPYIELARKVYLGTYFLFQIYDWLLINQPELVDDILTQLNCPSCGYR